MVRSADAPSLCHAAISKQTYDNVKRASSYLSLAQQAAVILKLLE